MLRCWICRLVQDAVTTPMEVDGPSPPDASTTSSGMSQAPTAADEEALDQELSQLRSRLRKVSDRHWDMKHDAHPFLA